MFSLPVLYTFYNYVLSSLYFLLNMRNSRTNRQGKGEITHYATSDFALNWCIELSVAPISIFESAESSLFGITRYSLPKFILMVKHRCMFAIFLPSVS